MTTTEILNHLNARGGETVNNEIAAKVAGMRGILSVELRYENKNHTDGYIHKRIIDLSTDEQSITGAESIADELERIAREFYYATFTVTQRIMIYDDMEREKTILIADYDHKTIPKWEQRYPKDVEDEDTGDEDHEFCSFFN